MISALTTAADFIPTYIIYLAMYTKAILNCSNKPYMYYYLELFTNKVERLK